MSAPNEASNCLDCEKKQALLSEYARASAGYRQAVNRLATAYGQASDDRLDRMREADAAWRECSRIRREVHQHTDEHRC